MSARLTTTVGQIRDERGGVMIFVAAGLLVLVLMAVFVIDVGNWWVHKRHLQTQADAAALAAANALGYPCDWAAAQTEGDRYGGAPYNPQVGGANQGSLTIRFNQTTFVHVPPNPDDTQVGSACDTGAVDTKLTEDDLPFLFSGIQSFLGLGPVVINAHARAEVRKVTSMSGFLPLAVQDAEPKHVFAQLVRADTGLPPASGCGVENPDCIVWLDQPDASVPIWTQSESVPIPTSLSVTVGLVYSKDKPTGPDYCPTDSASVQCYHDVSYVRGWTPSAAPALKDVRLLPGTCSANPYFLTAPCSPGISADLDAGSTALTAWATVEGSNTKYGLDPRTSSGDVTRSLLGGLPVSATGTTAIAVHWGTCKNPDTLKNCSDATGSPVTVAQRAFLRDDIVPLEAVLVGQSGPGSSGANTFETGTSQTLQVTVQVQSSLEAAASTSDPTVTLRAASGSGSNTQAVDCDPGSTGFKDEVENGCQTVYQVNDTAVCPNTDDPASCVPTQTGDFLGQLRQAFNARFGCPVNNWGVVPPEDMTTDDKRLVALLIVPPASFSTQGTHLVPVLKFAYFYVTGWDGGTSCSYNDPYPGDGAPHGDVWGHFVKYTGAAPGSVPSQDPCDLTSGDPSACIVALTR